MRHCGVLFFLINPRFIIIACIINGDWSIDRGSWTRLIYDVFLKTSNKIIKEYGDKGRKNKETEQKSQEIYMKKPNSHLTVQFALQQILYKSLRRIFAYIVSTQSSFFKTNSPFRAVSPKIDFFLCVYFLKEMLAITSVKVALCPLNEFDSFSFWLVRNERKNEEIK